MYYIINQETQLIMNVYFKNYRAKIIEKDRVIHSTLSPTEIVNNSAMLYGSSMEGRQKPVEKILKMKSKLPVPISPEKCIYFFPTTSIRNEECMWFSYYQIEHYIKYGKEVAVTLKNGNVVYVPVSLNQFDLQVKRTSQVIAYFHRLLFRPI